MSKTLLTFSITNRHCCNNGKAVEKENESEDLPQFNVRSFRRKGKEWQVCLLLYILYLFPIAREFLSVKDNYFANEF